MRHNNGRAPWHRVYELALPDDPRRYIAYGTGDAPWLTLTPRPGSPLAAFLAATPSPTWLWLPSLPMTQSEAIAVAKARRKQARQHGLQVIPANRVYRGPGPVVPIQHVAPDGTVRRFDSLRQAARIVGLDRGVISKLLGRTDCDGSRGLWRRLDNGASTARESSEIAH